MLHKLHATRPEAGRRKGKPLPRLRDRQQLQDDRKTSSNQFDPTVPNWLPHGAQMIWRELLAEMPAGWLQSDDRQMFADYVDLVYRKRRAVRAQAKLDRRRALPLTVDQAKGGLRASPYLAIIDNANRAMLKLQIEMGLTPASRLRLGIPNAPTEEHDPWAELDQAA